LKGLGYRLRANAKKLNRQKDPGRDAQFVYIAAMRESFAQAGLPVVSVDSKHRELVGDFKNPGATWEEEPILVNEPRLPLPGQGRRPALRVYDVAANHACVSVGTTHDTPDFAVDNLARWWACHGCRHYPGATELLVLADSGGSNGARTRAWKYGLQHRLCDRHGLTVTVCHYPSGASKWNPIEHRAFSEISKNWAGRPASRLRDRRQLHQHHPDQVRAPGRRPPCPGRLPHWHQGQRQGDEGPIGPPSRHPAQPQTTPSAPGDWLPESGKLFLRRP